MPAVARLLDALPLDEPIAAHDALQALLASLSKQHPSDPRQHGAQITPQALHSAN